jgi:hypothetical protein
VVEDCEVSDVTWKCNVLVVASVTAGSPELIGALRARAEKGPAAFTMVVPATRAAGGRAAARDRLEQALGLLHEAGLEADGSVGDEDPIVAVTDVWNPGRFDEIVVSTLPMGLSKWLHAALPERISKLTDAPVAHVVSEPPGHVLAPGRPPAHDRPSDVMGPFSVLAWGGRKHR